MYTPILARSSRKGACNFVDTEEYLERREGVHAMGNEKMKKTDASILEMVIVERNAGRFATRAVLVEHIWYNFDLVMFKVIFGVICFTCNFPEIRFPKRYFFYTYDSVSTKFLLDVPCDSPNKSYFLGFKKLKFKENIKKYYCDLI